MTDDMERAFYLFWVRGLVHILGSRRRARCSGHYSELCTSYECLSCVKIPVYFLHSRLLSKALNFDVHLSS